MRELVVILTVILVLLALTAVKYRKQIAALIGVARMLKDVRDAAQKNSIRGETAASVQLVNCAKCGVWVPQDRASKARNGYFYCSENCVKARIT